MSETEYHPTLRPPPHRTAGEYVKAMSGSGLMYYLTYPMLSRDWRNGGQHYSWTEKSFNKCVPKTGLVRGDGKVILESASAPRDCTTRDQFASVTNGVLKGVASGVYKFDCTNVV